MKTWRGMSLGLLLVGGLLAQGAWAGEWIADAKGCKVWNEKPTPGESVAWSGECEGGYANGKGALKWVVDGKTSETYEGDYKNGKKHGGGVQKKIRDGVLIFEKDGEFKEDVLNGNATVKSMYKDGIPTSVFSGNYVDGKIKGNGVWNHPDGSKFEGDLNGKGVHAFASGNRYEGDFVGGNFHGKGEFFWKNGDRYEGDFVKDKRTGKGVLFFANGNRYEGDFVGGDFHGKGVYVWKNGNRYEGDFVKDKRTGKGTLTFKNGDCYTGEFVDGKRVGKGVFTWSDGERYEGDFVDGNRTGKGLYTWKSGISYNGDFVNNKRNGFGFFLTPRNAYVAKNRSSKGQWVGSDFVELGIFKDDVFMLACVSKSACDDVLLEPYRAAFRDATTSSELNSFIEKYKDNDPDGLVSQASKKIPSAQKYEREQERLAAIKRAKEEREAYRAAFKNASSSGDLSAFVERYKNNDPEKLVPKARQKIPAAQKREREQSAREARAAQERAAHACDHLYVGKVVNAPVTGLVNLFGKKSEEAIVLGISQRNGVATVRSVSNSSMVGELSCSSLK